MGAASVAGQVMIPFAADLAPEERRGRVVARIMTGLLLGILLARTVSGFVAQAGGWRGIYWLSAGLMLCFAVVLWRALPAEGPRPHRTYAALVRTSLRLLVDRARAAPTGLARRRAFGAFSVLWTTIAFLLSGSPYRYSSAVIGLFGLVGAGGILAANVAGQAGRLGAGQRDDRRAPASSSRARSPCCGPAAPRWPRSSSASSCSTWAPRACRSPTRR